MITLRVDAGQPEMRAVRTAADAVKRGELVIFPTETVYGLAADAESEAAVKRVFEAKGRADKSPLPVQVQDLEHLTLAAAYVPDSARLLAERFWPGPMTLILPRNEAISALVTGGRKSVGVRIPDHPVALALLREVGRPMVATSANISGQRPPTDAANAVGQVGDSATITLDAGACRLGVSSTVIDATGGRLRILRRGTLGADEIRRVVGEIEEIEG